MFYTVLPCGRPYGDGDDIAVYTTKEHAVSAAKRLAAANGIPMAVYRLVQTHHVKATVTVEPA